jgi:hypothetical protein
MADNWIPGKNHFRDKPTPNTVSGSVHKMKDQALIVEELADKFVIFIVQKSNPNEIIAEVERGIETRKKANKRAEEWMSNNEGGV